MLKNKNILYTTVTTLAGLLIATSASAANEGFYLGGQLGEGLTHLSDASMTNQNSLNVPGYTESSSTSTSSNGLAGRLFAGYQVNQYLAAELGFTQFHNASQKISENVTIAGGGPNSNANRSSTDIIKTSAVDLVTKAILPVQDGFSLYGKLGVAYIMQNQSTTETAYIPGEGTYASKANVSTGKLEPTFGLGATYSLSQHLDADISWSRIQKISDSSIPSTDFFGLGLSYHFS